MVPNKLHTIGYILKKTKRAVKWFSSFITERMVPNQQHMIGYFIKKTKRAVKWFSRFITERTCTYLMLKLLLLQGCATSLLWFWPQCVARFEGSVRWSHTWRNGMPLDEKQVPGCLLHVPLFQL